jgi:predicted dehydrogenase
LIPPEVVHLMKTVRIGLIGCGRITSQHVEGYQKADGVQISALCAPRLEKAYALADEYGLQDAEFFTDYRDMIAQKGIVDAVDIMTPDYLHAPITIDCAEAGLHILCEKPMALNAAEASRMCDAVKSAGVIGMVGLGYRFNPAVLIAKRFIDEGRMGEIFHFRARLTVSRLSNPDIPLEWRQDRTKGGSGALSDLGAHLVDLARFLTDDEFAVVTGLGRIFIKNRVRAGTGERGEVTAYDAAAFNGMMKGGAMVNVEVSRFAAGGNTFELDGNRGSVRFMDGRLHKWEKEITDHQKPSSDFVPVDVNSEQFEPHETNIYATFARCLQTGIQARPDFQDGLICQRVLDAVDDSILTGRAASLEEV